MIESLRLLKVCRKTAVAARRIALQMIQMNIVSAPNALPDSLRHMTRMQLIRTLAVWRPEVTGYRDVATAYRITFKSLARRYLELHDEIADLDVMFSAVVDDLAPELVARNSIGYASAAQLLITVGDNLSGCALKPASRRCVAYPRFPPRPAKPNATASTAVATGPQTAPCISSPLAD